MVKYCLFLLFLIFPTSLFAMDATFYSDSFEWENTANGDIFTQNNYSAALCSWVPLGSQAYVYSALTGVVVQINDRPNCATSQNLIDLSRAAFTEFATPDTGRISDISVAPLGQPGIDFSKSIFSRYTYKSLFVELSSHISDTYFSRESIRFRWRVLDGKKHVFVYLEHSETHAETEMVQLTNSRGEFDFMLPLPAKPGRYYLVITSGTAFQIKRPRTITIIDPKTYRYPSQLPRDASSNISPVLNTKLNEAYLPLPEKTFATVTITQQWQIYQTQGQTPTFTDNNLVPGIAEYQISSVPLSTVSSLDRAPYSPKIQTGTIQLDRFHESIGREKVQYTIRGSSVQFRFRLPKDVKVVQRYYVTLPNGDVREYSMSDAYMDTDGYLKTGTLITGSFPIPDEGTYKFETVTSQWFAYFNFPIVRGNIWNITSPLTGVDPEKIRDNLATVRLYEQEAINRIRKQVGRQPLVLDAKLNALAQRKVENMAQYDYVGHWTPEGKDISDLAKEYRYPVYGYIAENVAGGNVSDIVLQDGLEESGSHRHTMVDPRFSKLGVGYVTQDGKTYISQVYWE